MSLEAGNAVKYTPRDPVYGVYVFVIAGNIECAGESLGQRDGMGISNDDRFHLQTQGEAEVLPIEVPME